MTYMVEQKNQKESADVSEPEIKSIDWMQIAAVLWQSKKFIGIITGVVTVLAVIISLILPESFKSTAVILPDIDKSKLASLGGMSDLAAIAGVSLGGEGSIAKLYPTIIKSESVLKNVIYAKYKTKAFSDSVNLIQFREIKGKTPERDFEIALQGLRTSLEITMDRQTSVLTMNITTEEPQLSADILNTVISALDNFIRTKRSTNASEQRKWIEARLVEVKADLEKSENTLKEFREKNRVVSGSPQLLLDQERLAIEVQINSTMYIELKKQYELVKIEEIRSTPVISVMDPPRPAAKKDKPKRKIIVQVSLMLALIGSGSYRIIKQMYGKNIQGWYRTINSA